MEITPEKYVQRLNENLQKKKVLLADMLHFTKEQSQYLDEDGIEGLQRLVDAKQGKIEAVDKLDEEFNVYFQRLKSVIKVDSLSGLDATGIPGARDLKASVAEILDLIQEISEWEQKNSRGAKELLGKLGNEMKRLNQGVQVSNAYAPKPINTSSYFIDKKK